MKYHNIVSPKNANFYFLTPVKNHGNTAVFIILAKDIPGAALVAGLAGGIVVILEDGRIIDTILYTVSQTMKDLGKADSVSVMYVIPY